MTLVKLMSEQEYRKVDAISYSMLSGVAKTPASLISTDKPEGPGLDYGSAVDTLAFDGEDVFKKKFAVYSGRSSSKMIETIIKDVISIIEQTNGYVDKKLDDYENIILQSAKNLNYGQTWGKETRLRKIKEEGGNDLFEFLIEAKDKTVLDSIEYQNVVNTVNTLYTHDFSRKWFTCNEDEEIAFQFPVFFTHNGYKCKSLFDIIKVDHKNKIIYPVDLKTSYDHVLGFPRNVLKWKYFIQASLYSRALSYWKLENPEYFNYRIEPFRFVIVSSQNPFKPLVYKTTPEDLYVGQYGGTVKRTGDKIKGFDQLIDDMQWHLDNEAYDYPREVYKSNGEIELGLFM